MNRRTTIIIVGVIAASAVLGYFIYTDQYKVASEQTNTPTNTAPINSNTNTALQTKYTYEFVGGYDPTHSNSTADGKIYQVDDKGVRTLIVPSIKEAYPELKQAFNWTFGLVSKSEAKGYLYFTKILLDTDAPPTDLIRFDGNTKKFTKLAITSYYTGYSTAAASKNTPFAASVINPQSESDEQTLYLLDLDQDKAKVVTKLPAGQTFNSCHEGNCLGGKISSIEWLSGTQYQVGIYSTTETATDGNDYLTRKLIEKRKFNIN